MDRARAPQAARVHGKFIPLDLISGELIIHILDSGRSCTPPSPRTRVSLDPHPASETHEPHLPRCPYIRLPQISRNPHARRHKASSVRQGFSNRRGSHRPPIHFGRNAACRRFSLQYVGETDANHRSGGSVESFKSHGPDWEACVVGLGWEGQLSGRTAATGRK